MNRSGKLKSEMILKVLRYDVRMSTSEVTCGILNRFEGFSSTLEGPN